MTDRHPALLVFEDGFVAEGLAFGARGEAFGEVVFNTAMSGYQEILTDPSYRGQLVLMTYPLIGNYGVNPEDVESHSVHTRGLIVREVSQKASNFRSVNDLGGYLTEHNVVGITDVDTREIVLHIREKGSMRAVISSADQDVAKLLEKVRQSPSLDGRDCVREVTRWEEEHWTEGFPAKFVPAMKIPSERFKVVAYDFGIKNNILRCLVQSGFDVVAVPARTPAAQVMKEHQPDGIFLSNGPGDPEPVSYAVENIKWFLEEQVPTFGICLGHQLTALALGAKTYKMKFGHHGANQPVIDLTTGKTEITSQNHSFAVDADSVDEKRARITHRNLNDDTVEGLELTNGRAFTVQYHPEAAPGPRDALYLFDRFRKMMEAARAPAG